MAGKFQMFWLAGFQWFGAGMDVTWIFGGDGNHRDQGRTTERGASVGL